MADLVRFKVKPNLPAGTVQDCLAAVMGRGARKVRPGQIVEFPRRNLRALSQSDRCSVHQVLSKIT